VCGSGGEVLSEQETHTHTHTRTKIIKKLYFEDDEEQKEARKDQTQMRNI